MIAALSLSELDKKINKIYDLGEKRIIGIMLARYNISLVKHIVNDCYEYWHSNSEKGFDIFWPGYGEYLPHDMECGGRKILDFKANQNRVYFDLNKFISSKKEISSFGKVKYKDRFEILLVNYYDGHIHYDKYICVDLEKNLDNNYASIREFIEFITEQCRSINDIDCLRRKIISEDIKKQIKGISFSKAISTTNKVISYLSKKI